MDIVEESRWRPTELGALALHTDALLARVEALEALEARVEALEEGAVRRQAQLDRALDALERHIDGLRGDLQDHEWRQHR